MRHNMYEWGGDTRGERCSTEIKALKVFRANSQKKMDPTRVDT